MTGDARHVTGFNDNPLHERYTDTLTVLKTRPPTKLCRACISEKMKTVYGCSFRQKLLIYLKGFTVRATAWDVKLLKRNAPPVTDCHKTLIDAVLYRHKTIHYTKRHPAGEDCIMRRFGTCTLHKMLLGWSREREWDGSHWRREKCIRNVGGTTWRKETSRKYWE
jgi:hypothetical protein